MKIKCISLNVWLGGKLMDRILDFLVSERPDILLIQEVYNGQNPLLDKQYRSLEIIQEKLNFPFQDFAPMYLEKLEFGKLERGNAILSNLPIIERSEYWLYGKYGEYEDLPDNYQFSPRNLEHVVIDAMNTELNVFNFQGVVDFDGERDSPDRLHMSDVIVSAIEGRQHIILAGDTNVRPNTLTISNIEKKLTNVFKDELTTTFNISRKDLAAFPGYATSVVDMFFVSPDMNVVKHSCPLIDISDHLPLMATLEICSAEK